MKELFKKQLEGNKSLTEDDIQNLNKKTYFNGEDIKSGDVVLFAMLTGNPIEKTGEITQLPTKMITLNKKHLDLFTYKKRMNYNIDNKFPVIELKKIKNGTKAFK